MSAGSQRIICRRCKETITVDEDSCPHCGATVRGMTPFAAAVVAGVVLMGSVVLNTDLLPFGVIGLLLAAAGGYMIYNQRQRMQRAGQRA
ncbi:hypothetical protein OB955_15125 [Halobacteria archaeon AArc-m2/3/4]|uniref:Uncharacterized protein n=1 Tax=Natronoglomus mannanivorans TaxID=2979990 RepID=A0AAP2Z2E8_9EURY|nr:hypothetical protein [Halobacteria archaeon AArc-xg1-1]MCU4974060.1 hypothetical protein [Halobacteria archaeon AArc-m2/3/4]